MPSIQIRIGASLGRDVASVYKPLVTAARAARAQIERELNGIKIEVGSTRGGPYREMVTAAQQADRAIVASARKRNAEIASEDAKRSRDSERATESLARRTSYRAVRHFGSAMNAAAGVAGGVARGAGVDFSMAGMVGRAVNQESAAVSLANQGFMPGVSGANGQLQSSAGILAEARGTAQKYARETDEILEATGKFVGLTGDLATARSIMGDLAKLSNATGSNLGDMASAAASVSTALDQGFSGTAEQKIQATNDVMRAIAGQGKVGAVEIKDLAAQMAKLAAASGQFAGKREDLLAFVGVMAQESRKAGGSASATQAATSILSFATNLSKPSKAQQKVMAQYGLDPYADKGKTAVKSPEQFIQEAIVKTKGNLQALGGIFSTAGSMRAVRGFANIYNQAGGGEAGRNAVAKEIADLKRATLEREEIERANAAVLETSKAKAIQFQNNLETVAAAMATRVLPQLEKLGPAILQGVDAFGKFAGWVAENPGKAVAAALTASIARAGIESVVRSGIDQLIKSAIAGGPGIMGGGKTVAGVTMPGGAMGAVATIGAGLTIAAAAVTIEQVGELVIDKVAKHFSDKQDAAQNSEAEDLNALNAAARAARRTGGVTAEQANAVRAAVDRQRARVADLGTPTDDVGKLALAQQTEALNRMVAILDGIRNGTLRVREVNPQYGGLGVPGGGRTGPETFGPGGNGWGQGMFR